MIRPSWELETPVAFFIFNRPNSTRQVFEAIRAARPRRLLVVADGPRSDRVGEEERCREARSILAAIDWDCRIDTNFADENLGCMRRVSSGLDWVFQQVEEAIILEDDCLPDPSFFVFCSELLDRFRDEPRIAQICGVNFQFGRRKMSSSYYFSRHNHVWGWATWRRAWELNDNEMTGWPEFRDSNGLDRVLPDKTEISYWIKVLDGVYAGEIDTWDCRWTLSCWRKGMLTVMPAVNLISNIGFGPDATHTPVPNRYASMRTEVMNFPLIHSSSIVADCGADAYTGKTFFKEYSMMRRLIAALRGSIPLHLPKVKWSWLTRIPGMQKVQALLRW